MPFDLIRSVINFLTPKPIQQINSRNELVDMGYMIETYNECNEARYIQMERNIQIERRIDLELLLTKCKQLLSFIEARNYNGSFNKMSIFIDKVRIAKYRGDDITNLFREFEDIENNIKRRSQSFNNLSQMRMIG
jgi:hypothetical protein|tara:strand:+ start:206 stop:610 length:405 start_codon:yes stop_codon:yes gene_type:complete